MISVDVVRAKYMSQIKRREILSEEIILYQNDLNDVMSYRIKVGLLR